MTDEPPPDIKVNVTRRPHRRRRQFDLVTRMRLRNLAAPLDAPGAEMVDLPVIGVVVLALLVLLALFVVGTLLGGFLVALIELIALGLLGLAGSVWAWLRGHPKVAVVDIGAERWLRDDGPSVSPVEDARMIAEGANPAMLGYRQAN